MRVPGGVMWGIFAVLLVLWAAGTVLNFGAPQIHLLLLLAVAQLIAAIFRRAHRPAGN